MPNIESLINSKRELLFKIKEYTLRIEETRSNLLPRSGNGVRTSGGTNRTSTQERVSIIIDNLKRKVEELQMEVQKIDALIDEELGRISDPEARWVVSQRLVHNLSWKEIDCGSKSKARRLFNEGLNQLKSLDGDKSCDY